MRILFFLVLLQAHCVERYFHPVTDKINASTMSNIDFIYMINLDERPEKYEKSMNVLRPYGISPHRFSAVNGWTLPFQALDELGVIYQPGLPEGPLSTVFRHEDGDEFFSCEIMKEPGVSYYCHSFTRGAIGCILSHLSVLQDAWESGYQTIWIIEDDINVISNPHTLSSLVVQLGQVDPNWDVLFTDNEIKGGHGERVHCGGILPRPLVSLQPLSYYLQRVDVHPDLLKIGLRYGSHSMIVHRSGMIKILEYFKKNKLFFPYDMEYCFVPEIRMYECKQDIVTNIAGGPSDLGTPSYKNKN